MTICELIENLIASCHVVFKHDHYDLKEELSSETHQDFLERIANYINAYDTKDSTYNHFINVLKVHGWKDGAFRKPFYLEALLYDLYAMRREFFTTSSSSAPSAPSAPSETDDDSQSQSSTSTESKIEEIITIMEKQMVQDSNKNNEMMNYNVTTEAIEATEETDPTEAIEATEATDPTEATHVDAHIFRCYCGIVSEENNEFCLHHGNNSYTGRKGYGIGSGPCTKCATADLQTIPSVPFFFKIVSGLPPNEYVQRLCPCCAADSWKKSGSDHQNLLTIDMYKAICDYRHKRDSPISHGDDLYWAAFAGKVDQLVTLIRKGYYPRYVRDLPLRWACTNGNLECALILLVHGAMDLSWCNTHACEHDIHEPCTHRLGTYSKDLIGELALTYIVSRQNQNYSLETRRHVFRALCAYATMHKLSLLLTRLKYNLLRHPFLRDQENDLLIPEIYFTKDEKLDFERKLQLGITDGVNRENVTKDMFAEPLKEESTEPTEENITKEENNMDIKEKNNTQKEPTSSNAELSLSHISPGDTIRYEGKTYTVTTVDWDADHENWIFTYKAEGGYCGFVVPKHLSSGVQVISKSNGTNVKENGEEKKPAHKYDILEEMKTTIGKCDQMLNMNIGNLQEYLSTVKDTLSQSMELYEQVNGKRLFDEYKHELEHIDLQWENAFGTKKSPLPHDQRWWSKAECVKNKDAFVGDVLGYIRGEIKKRDVPGARDLNENHPLMRPLPSTVKGAEVTFTEEYIKLLSETLRTLQEREARRDITGKAYCDLFKSLVVTDAPLEEREKLCRKILTENDTEKRYSKRQSTVIWSKCYAHKPVLQMKDSQLVREYEFLECAEAHNGNDGKVRKAVYDGSEHLGCQWIFGEISDKTRWFRFDNSGHAFQIETSDIPKENGKQTGNSNVPPTPPPSPYQHRRTFATTATMTPPKKVVRPQVALPSTEKHRFAQITHLTFEFESNVEAMFHHIKECCSGTWFYNVTVEYHSKEEEEECYDLLDRIFDERERKKLGFNLMTLEMVLMPQLITHTRLWLGTKLYWERKEMINKQKQPIEWIQKQCEPIEEEEIACPICMDDIDRAMMEIITIEGCNHVYHERCLTDWNKTQTDEKKITCPMCSYTEPKDMDLFSDMGFKNNEMKNLNMVQKEEAMNVCRIETIRKPPPGWQLQHVPADGNCFYHAFIEGLKIIPEEHHKIADIPYPPDVANLRSLVADEILKNKDIYEDLVDEWKSENVLGDAEVMTPCLAAARTMMREWATNTIIHILAVKFKVNIHVHGQMKETWHIQKFPYEWKEHDVKSIKDEIHVVSYPELGHFDFLLPERTQATTSQTSNSQASQTSNSSQASQNSQLPSSWKFVHFALKMDGNLVATSHDMDYIERNKKELQKKNPQKIFTVEKVFWKFVDGRAIWKKDLVEEEKDKEVKTIQDIPDTQEGESDLLVKDGTVIPLHYTMNFGDQIWKAESQPRSVFSMDQLRRWFRKSHPGILREANQIKFYTERDPNHRKEIVHDWITAAKASTKDNPIWVEMVTSSNTCNKKSPKKKSHEKKKSLKKKSHEKKIVFNSNVEAWDPWGDGYKNEVL